MRTLIFFLFPIADDDLDDLIAELCDRMPEAVYNSTGRDMTVVFEQGEISGLRWFTMNFTAIKPSKSELFYLYEKNKLAQ